MARKSREELDEIVRRELPGYHVAPQAAPDPRADGAIPARRAAPDAGTPDLDTLRRKYLRNPGAGGQTAADELAGGNPGPDAGDAGRAGDADDDQIVAIAPDDHPDPWDRAVRPKSVVIDPDGKILGAQG
jgi:hypothetical protein